MFGNKNEKVKCEDCKCLLDKNDAQMIPYFFDSLDGPDSRRSEQFYCQRDRKDYEVAADLWGSKERTYYRLLQVNSDGSHPFKSKIINNK